MATLDSDDNYEEVEMQSPSSTTSAVGVLRTSFLSTTVVDHLRGGRPWEPLPSTPSSSTPSAVGSSGASAATVIDLICAGELGSHRRRRCPCRGRRRAAPPLTRSGKEGRRRCLWRWRRIEGQLRVVDGGGVGPRAPPPSAPSFIASAADARHPSRLSAGRGEEERWKGKGQK
uniref:Uncharacterized protein n=1 Tax=Oryza meridionalis TaxID=40149 RepID=A0A0E0DZH7_9ORYZ